MTTNTKMFIERSRKICWDAEYENDEYCIGENKVSQYIDKLQNKIDEAIRFIRGASYEDKYDEGRAQLLIKELEK